MEKLLEAIAGTAELMGAQLSPNALAMMARDLQPYNSKILMQALMNVRKTSRFFNLAVIIEELEKLNPDGRLGSDEAWALYPHNEASSAVITDEMAAAMQVAYPLLQEGDNVGARMSFKEAYNRIVNQNKMNGIAPKWFPSLGTDKDSRQLVIDEAVRLGRLTQDHALSLLPPVQNLQITNQVLAVKESLRITQSKEFTAEERAKAKHKIEKIKAMLIGKV